MDKKELTKSIEQIVYGSNNVIRDLVNFIIESLESENERK
jgi:hypothetical protein